MVTGNLRIVLRVEGLFILALSVLAYRHLGESWGYFALLFLLPDLSLLGYLAGPRIGALAYNCAHSLIGPLGLLAFAALQPLPEAAPIALIWLAHIGFDRAMGYGLKYADSFTHTHLGLIGKAREKESSGQGPEL